MKALRLYVDDFRQFKDCEVVIGNKVTAIAGNNGTGKSTILGLLANSSSLGKYKTYMGKPFRGEFSELFSGSPTYDLPGKKIRLDYVEHGQKQEISFRISWQNNKTRFRVIPQKTLADGKTSSAKIVSPVIYLGLSRLYPLGEADDDALSFHKQRWTKSEDRDWFIKNYKNILSIRTTEIENVSSFDVAHSRKHGTGVKTDKYNPSENSAGQDNLGQILMAVLSFKSLKRLMDDEWDGGLLLIDEIDATLHPAAQRRLVDLLLKEAGECGFQVVFTTHSTVVLEELANKAGHRTSDGTSDIEIAYLSDASRKLEVKQNPSWHTMANDLFVRGPGGQSPRVGVFSEDDEARWIMNEIIEASCPELISHINFIDAAFGCGNLIHLYTHDYPYMRDRIVVFDGDVSQESIEKIPKHYRNEAKNIVKLPGSVRPEQIIWEYLEHAEESDPVWYGLNQYGYTWRSIDENGPSTYRGDDERNQYKNWLRACENDFHLAGVIKCWANANPNEAQAFIKQFIGAYNEVARRTSADPMPMAKQQENL